MIELRSTVQRGILCAAKFLRRGFVACVFTGLVAIAALAQTAPAQEVTVTLLPSHTCTDATATPCGDLKVTDSNANYEGKPLGRNASWLYFDASALPKDNEISITRAQLQLVRKTGEGLNRGMVIRVLSAEASPSGGAAPRSYKDGVEVARLQSDRRNCSDDAKCSDSVKWSTNPTGAGLLQTKEDDKSVRYIGLLLIPSDETASSRAYYGLRNDPEKYGNDSELRDKAREQPRLMVTYHYLPSYLSRQTFGCTSEPVALANLQSEGGPARISGCEFISKENSPRQDEYAPYKIADDSLTVTPAVYGDLIFVVRNNKWSDCPGPDAEKPQGTEPEAVCLEARKPLGGVVWKAWVDAKGKFLGRSRMVVNRFGRLRIITGDAIYSFQLKPKQTCPEPRTEKTVAFGAPPAEAAEGPDGTLYIVSKGIFALNPDFAPLDAAGHPRKLWWITLGNAASADARITLSPDGRFLYVLALLSDESKFLVINTQTGKDVDLIHEVPDPKFPTNLLTLYNPVVARHEDGADYVFIAGNLGTKGVLWGVKNKAVMTRDGDYQAKLTEEWMDETDGKIGQPILDSIPEKPADLSAKKLYFLISRSVTPEFRAVGALNGKTVNAWSGKEVLSTCTVSNKRGPMSQTNGTWFCDEDFGEHSGVHLYDVTPSIGVDTEGTVVTPPRFVDFSAVDVGQEFSIGSRTCTVTEASPRKLTCKEDLGSQKNVTADLPWAKVNTSGHQVTWVGGNSFRHTVGGKERIGIRGTPLPANISTAGKPVADSAGNIMLWANDTFYGFTAEASLLFNPKLPELGEPQLLFGPGGTLYAASGGAVSALIPSFNLDALGNHRKIKSPTSLQVTGTATPGAPWELEARGSVIHGNGFQVQKGATLSVKVPGEPPSLSALGEIPCACAPVNTSILGTVVTSISGQKFEKTVVGQQILIGSSIFGFHLCTVATKTSNTSLTCKENLGEHPAGSAFSNSPAVVKTDGTVVMWISGTKFSTLFANGNQDLFIGSRRCTLAKPLLSGYTVQCKEDQGKSDRILAYRVDGTVSASPLRSSTPNNVCK